jgi:hypothetical protein
LHYAHGAGRTRHLQRLRMTGQPKTTTTQLLDFWRSHRPQVLIACLALVVLVIMLSSPGSKPVSRSTAAPTTPGPAPATPPTTAAPTTAPPATTEPTNAQVSNLPGNDLNCDGAGLCEAKAACAAWAWSDQYIQDALNQVNNRIDISLQWDSDNPLSTSSPDFTTDSPYQTMVNDSTTAAVDDPNYQLFSKLVTAIDDDINNLTGSTGIPELAKVASDSSKVGSWCKTHT